MKENPTPEDGPIKYEQLGRAGYGNGDWDYREKEKKKIHDHYHR